MKVQDTRKARKMITDVSNSRMLAWCDSWKWFIQLLCTVALLLVNIWTLPQYSNNVKCWKQILTGQKATYENNMLPYYQIAKRCNIHSFNFLPLIPLGVAGGQEPISASSQYIKSKLLHCYANLCAIFFTNISACQFLTTETWENNLKTNKNKCYKSVLSLIHITTPLA